ncbi:MAG: diguanylate cyclase, partial [Methylococcales bacterium]
VGRVWSFRDVTERKRMEQRLRDSENSFRNLFENAPLPYQSLDIEGNLLYVNQAWLDMVGCQLKDVVGRFFGDFMIESSKLLVTQTFSQFKKEGYVSSPIFELVCRDTREERLVTVNGRISRDAQGLFQHTHCILIDVTEQYRLEVELKESEFRWKFAIEGAGDGVWDWNIETDEATYSKRWKEMLGYDETDILPLNDEWAMRIYPDDQSYVAKNMQDYLQGKTEIYVVEYRLKCKDDSYKWILGRGMVVSRGKDGQPLRMIGTHTDITERKAAEEEIKQLAFFDPLTGLPNRRKLSDRLHYSIAINRRNHSQFAVFMMDLDKFKAVNDSLGHAAGDELLKQVAARIINCLRESDMVARLGGDEFVLVLENLKIPKAAEKIALKVIADLTLPFQLSNNHTVQIGASIGISIYPQDGNTSEKLMDHADTALYQAKDNGRGCFAYFSEVSSTINNV